MVGNVRLFRERNLRATGSVLPRSVTGTTTRKSISMSEVPASTIHVDQLTFAYKVEPALRDVTF